MNEQRSTVKVPEPANRVVAISLADIGEVAAPRYIIIIIVVLIMTASREELPMIPRL